MNWKSKITWSHLNAPDANLLLYAYNLSLPLHAPAKAYLEEALSADEPYGIPILSLHAFVRISTGTAWKDRRLSMSEAIQIVDSWTAHAQVQILYPGPRHWIILRNLIAGVPVTSKQFSDAAIAAIAVEHNATIHTHDQDFARFRGIRWHNPLQS